MRLLVIGAGGHAKVVVSSAVEAGWEIVGIIDETGARAELMGRPVLGDAKDLEANAFVIAVGDNRIRAERFEHHMSGGLTAATIIHPSAVIDPSATIGPGTVVFAGVIVNASTRIGDNVILNTGCTIDHDCIIGSHAHIAPGVNLSGGVTVGVGALLGVGACAIPLARVGAWATVGAGSAVTSDVPEDATFAGVPARRL